MLASALIAVLISTAAASRADEGSIMLDWALLEEPLFQGEIANLSVAVRNLGVKDVELHSISVHPDWMPRYYFYRVDLSSQPVRVTTGGSYSCNLSFTVPGGLPPGSHAYYGKVQFSELDSSGQPGSVLAWIGPNETMVVHDVQERVFSELLSVVHGKKACAEALGLTHPDALALYEQASDEYSMAVEQGEDGRYAEAVSRLTVCSTLFDKAVATEEGYWREVALNATASAEEKLVLPSLRQPESAEAQSLTSEGWAALSEAEELLEGEDYRGAIARAGDARGLAERALQVEADFQKSKTELYMLVGALVTALACVALVAALGVWKRARGGPEA